MSAFEKARKAAEYIGMTFVYGDAGVDILTVEQHDKDIWNAALDHAAKVAREEKIFAGPSGVDYNLACDDCAAAIEKEKA